MMISLFLSQLLMIMPLMHADISWQAITSVSRDCPRFVHFPMRNEGLGDMIGRIVVASAIALTLKATMVFDSKFWQHSTRHSFGYEDIFEHELGIPVRDFLLFDNVMTSWQPVTIGSNVSPDALLFRANHTTLSCNTIVHSTQMRTCYANARLSWCLSTIFNVAQEFARPLISQSIDTIASHRKLYDPMKANKVNIVWHLRTGDVCLSCDNSTFYENIHSFISESLTLASAEYVNVIVHQPDDRVRALFAKIPNTIFMNNTTPLEAVRYFMNSDILVTTGSSFANSVSLFTPLHRPLVLQALDKDATPEYHKMIDNPLKPDTENMMVKYFLNEGRAIRLDRLGRAVNYQPADMEFILKHNGVLERVLHYKLNY